MNDRTALIRGLASREVQVNIRRKSGNLLEKGGQEEHSGERVQKPDGGEMLSFQEWGECLQNGQGRDRGLKVGPRRQGWCTRPQEY